MVMVTVAALGVVAMTRLATTDVSVTTEADHLARDLRHAQLLAMTWGQTLRFTPAAGGYGVSCASGSSTPPCNGAAAVADPANAATPFARTLQTGVTLGGAALDIDSLGRPVAAGALLTSDRAFTLTDGARTSTVNVARLTGFVAIVY